MQSQNALKIKKFKKIIEKNDDVIMHHYIKIILVSLNFLQPKLEGVTIQIRVTTHYLRTPAIDYSTVMRWVKRINDGQKGPAKSNLCDRPRTGRPSSAHNSANIDQADALIKKNRRITINELAESLGVSAGCAVKIIDYPRVFKSVCKAGPKVVHRCS